MWIQYNHKGAHLKKRKAEELMPVMQKEREFIKTAFENAKGLHIQEMWEVFKSGEKQRKARNTVLSTP